MNVSEDSESSASMNDLADHSLKNGTDVVKYQGVSMKSGKWRARIRHPISKARIWIGTYESLEEATNAYNKMKVEFDEELKKDKPDLESIITARNSTDLAGVSRRKSGKWRARIQHPITKDRIWLGTYDSQEDAIDAYNKMKLELDDEMKKDEPDLERVISARSCIRKIRGSVYRVEKGKGRWRWRADIRTKEFRTYLGLYASAEEARAAVDRKISSLDSSKACGITEDSEPHKRKRDAVGSSVGVEADAELAHGRENEEFDLGVIDANGRLVGEFSRLDDELWLCRSLADDPC